MIVGAGISGIMASYEFKLNYPEVRFITLEKLDVIGGSLPMAGGAMIAMHSRTHQAAGKEAEMEDIISVLEISMGHEADREYVTNIYEHADAWMDRLVDLGVEFNLNNVTPASRANNDRLSAIAAMGNGAGFTSFLNQAIRKDPFDLRMHSQVTELIVEDGQVIGVKVEDAEKTYNIYADAVLLATGGFSNSRAMLEKYIPLYQRSISRSGAGATGDGIVLTERFQPEIVGQANAMGGSLRASPTTAKLSGNFVVAADGKRFANETNANAMIRAIGENNLSAYLLMDGKFENTAALEAGIDSGLVRRFDTL